MNNEQWEHLGRIQNKFNAEHREKYIKGAKEHGTLLHKDFPPEQLVDMAIEEVQDLVSYLYTLRERMNGNR